MKELFAYAFSAGSSCAWTSSAGVGGVIWGRFRCQRKRHNMAPTATRMAPMESPNKTKAAFNSMCG